MNIIILGDIILDRNIYCNSKKINSETPNIVFNYNYQNYNLGGCVNVAQILKNLDNNVFLLSVLGNDSNANILCKLLDDNNITNEYLILSNRPTTIKERFICNTRQIFRIDNEITDKITSNIEEEIYTKFLEICDKNNIDGLIISDYNKGIITHDLSKKIISHCNSHDILTFVDPKPENINNYYNITLLKPNRYEFSQLSKNKSDISDISNYRFLTKKYNIKYLLVTLDKDGMNLFNSEKNKLINFKNEITMNNLLVDTTGAGDIVIAVFVNFYLREKNLNKSINYANKLSSYSVTVTGNLKVTKLLVKKIIFKSKIITLNEFKEINRSNVIVFTNGCFDILHSGHLDYLNKSKKLGDILIIGLNSDNSVKLNKGSSRPINNVQERASMLSGFPFVDYIIIFDEKTPYNLIKEIKPDILVKGSDYTREEVIGNDLVKKVILIDYKKGFSTSNIINKIKST